MDFELIKLERNFECTECALNGIEKCFFLLKHLSNESCEDGYILVRKNPILTQCTRENVYKNCKVYNKRHNKLEYTIRYIFSGPLEKFVLRDNEGTEFSASLEDFLIEEKYKNEE